MKEKSNDQVAVTQAYQRVFNTDDGELVLRDLAKASGFMANSFTTDPLEMAFNNGNRDLFIRIITTLGVDTLKMIELIKEENQPSEDIYDN